MDNIPAAVSGGGVTGAIIIVCWLLYKCCEKRSSRCHSLCMDISVSDGASPNLRAPREAATPDTKSAAKPEVVVV